MPSTLRNWTVIWPMVLAALACNEHVVTAENLDKAPNERERSLRLTMYQRYLHFGEAGPGNLLSPHWLADGKRFWYAVATREGTAIYLVDPEANTKKPLFNVGRLRRSLAEALGHHPVEPGLPFATFTFLDGERRIQFVTENRSWLLDLANYSMAEAPQNESRDAVRKPGPAAETSEREVASPGGRAFVTEKSFNLFLRRTGNDLSERLTRDGIRDYAWRLDEARWSPDGAWLAVSKEDQRNLPSVPVVDWLKPQPEVTWVHRQCAARRFLGSNYSRSTSGRGGPCRSRPGRKLISIFTSKPGYPMDQGSFSPARIAPCGSWT